MKKFKLTKRALKKLGKLSSNIEGNLTKIERFVAHSGGSHKFSHYVWELMQAWASIDYYVYKHSTTKKQRDYDKEKE